MADTTALKNRIRAAIKSNDNQEITGPVLQQALLDMVDELNGATETEASQRQSNDNTLQQNINTERQARIDADGALGQRITEENQRAQTAEQNLQQNIDKILLKRSITPPSSSAFWWAFNNVLKGKTGWARISNASTAFLYDGRTPIPGGGFAGEFKYFDFSALTQPRFYIIAADASKDVVLEFFDEPSVFKFILDNKNNIAQINTALNEIGIRIDNSNAQITQLNRVVIKKINFVSSLPETFNSGNPGTYFRHSWYFSFSLVRKMLDTFGVFSIYMEITASAQRSQSNGALYCNESTNKKNISFHEEDGVLTTGLMQINFNEDDYDFALAHYDNLPFFWQWSGGGDVTFSVVQAYYFGSNVVNEQDLDNIEQDLDNIEETFEIKYRGYSAMTAIDVKKDGSGDFTTIQEAINSIVDASVINQYVINIYDDFEVNDLTQLWKVGTPTQRNTEVAPSTSIALVVLKDWIHIRGIGSPKRLYVESPNVDMPGSCFRYIQTVYPKGNCTIENLYIGIQGGRYAIHQEANGSTSSPDYHATTHYKDLVVEHKGNYMYTNGSSWNSTMAQANGTAPGLKVIYEHVKWISDCNIPFYTHTNLQNGSKSYDEPNEVTFINCSMVTNKNVSLSNFNPYWSDIGSNKITRIKMIGCNFPKFSAGLGGSRGLETTVLKTDVESGGARVTGNGNIPMVPFVNSFVGCLGFKTIELEQTIDITGGSAYDLIWGSTIRKYEGTVDSVGKILGKRYISEAQSWASDTPSQVYTLAHILGNCASNPKTLIVKVGNVEYTINLNKNYVTSDGSDYTPTTVPAYSNSQIITDINNQFPDVFVCERDYYEMYSFDDCQEMAVNRTAETINAGDAVCHDYANGFNAWRLANSGEKADGIAGCRINPSVNGYDNVGNIILADKAIFENNLIGIPSGATAGSTFILGSGRRKNWYQGTGNNATFVAIGGGYCKYIK